MLKWLMLAVVGAAGVVGWLAWQQSRAEPLVVSGFVEADQIRLGSRVGGRVAEVLASEGQLVKAGEPLFRLEPFDLSERLAKAEGEASARQAELNRLKAGARAEDIDQAKARRARLAATLDKLRIGPRAREIDIALDGVRLWEANLEFAQAEQERVQTLFKQNNASPTEVDKSVRDTKTSQAQLAAYQHQLAQLHEGTRPEEIAEAEASLAEADAALRLLQAGTRAEDIEQATARLAAAQADVAAVKRQIDELTVRVPSDVLVEATDVRPGDLVLANVATVSVLDVSRLWVRTYVPEGKLARLKLGQRVPMRIDGFPASQRFTGRVTFVATEGEFTPRNVQTPEERSKQVFRIKVTLDDDAKQQLRPGMMADVLLEEATFP